MDKRPTVIDLFCGAGGLSQGFQQAGFRVLLGADVNQNFGETFLRSHTEAEFLGKPIEVIESSEIAKATGLIKGELDVLVGGPPCQGYSIYNHDRGEHDPRAGLFREYLRLVEALAPKWLVMENVTGILSIGGGQLLAHIMGEIAKLGYSTDWRVLRSEDFGVPQLRRRVFIIANRVGAPIAFPPIEYGTVARPLTTIGDAIGDLPLQASASAEYFSAPLTPYQKLMRDGCSRLLNHQGPKLGRQNMERIQYIPQGGSWRDIPLRLLPEGMKRAKRSDHTKRYGRPKLSDLACTILTKCDIHWGAFIHPIEDRAFTVRETARLQSFPDNFVFCGSMTEQFVQVGNAVPPMMARAIAKTIFMSGQSVRRFAA